MSPKPDPIELIGKLADVVDAHFNVLGASLPVPGIDNRPSVRQRIGLDAEQPNSELDDLFGYSVTVQANPMTDDQHFRFTTTVRASSPGEALIAARESLVSGQRG